MRVRAIAASTVLVAAPLIAREQEGRLSPVPERGPRVVQQCDSLTATTPAALAATVR